MRREMTTHPTRFVDRTLRASHPLSIVAAIGIASAACGSPAQSAPASVGPEASHCQPDALDAVDGEVGRGRIRAALRAVEAARICPKDRTRALILRIDLMFRLGRTEAARKLLDADGAGIDAAHTRVFRRRLERVASASAQPASIDEALKDLEASHAAAALEGFNGALGQNDDDVPALIGAGLALRALDRQRESRERLDHALDVAERVAGEPATPVLLRISGTDWNGSRVEMLPESKEQRVFFGKLRTWQPVRLIGEGYVASDGAFAVARDAGGPWTLVSPRSLHGLDLGAFDSVALRPDGKYVLTCAAGKKVLFEKGGNRVSEVARPCLSSQPRFEGEVVVERSDDGKQVQISSLPSLRALVDAPSDPPVHFSAQQMALVPGVAPSDTARLVDLRAGKIAATVHGKALTAAHFALRSDAKRLLWQDGLEVRSMDLESAAETSLGSARTSNDRPMGYLTDGRACLVAGESSNLPPASWGRGSIFPSGKPPRGWVERCIVHADRSATAALVPAKSRLLARAEDATTVLNEAASADGKLAAFLDTKGEKGESFSAVVVNTDLDHPGVVQRIALAGPSPGAVRLGFSADATKLAVGEQIYEIATGVKGSPIPPADVVAEHPPVNWRDPGKPDGPATDREPLDRRVVGSTVVKPGPSVTREDLFEPGSKAARSTPVVIHDSITVERDRFGVVRWSRDGKPLASIVAFDQGRRYVAFLPDRKVEILGQGAAPENLYCRVGRFVLPLEVCRDERIVRGDVERILSGAKPQED